MARAKMPSDAALDIAIMWLRDNEGDEGEADACKSVADWLDSEKDERWLRSQARAAGVPVARLRRKLRENSTEGNSSCVPL